MIRISTKRDAEEELKLWQAGFPGDGEEYIDDYIKNRSHAFIGLYDDSALAAGLHIVPVTLDVRGAKFRSGLVAGVATKPEFRHRGYASRLMDAAHVHMAAMGMAISMLEPFLAEFYEPFGYRTVAYKRRVSPSRDGGGGGVHIARDVSELMAIYRLRAGNTTCHIARSVRDFEFMLRDARYDGYTPYVSNDLDAYALARKDGDTVDVMEMLGIFGESEEKLAGALSLHFGREVVAEVRCGEFEDGATGRMMLRPLLLEDVLRRVPTTGGGELMLNVADDSFERNSGGYILRSDGVGRVSVERSRVDLSPTGAGELLMVLIGGGTDAPTLLNELYPAGDALMLERY